MGRGSPWRGSRDIHRRDSCAVVVKAWWPVRYRWGVVALGVVAGQETSVAIETKANEINRAHKNPHHKIPLWKSIQHIYKTPEILRSIFSTDSCLQSDNGVSTSNSPPARNIVMIYPDYYVYWNVNSQLPKYCRVFLYSYLENKNVAFAKTIKSIPYFCKHTHDN